MKLYGAAQMSGDSKETAQPLKTLAGSSRGPEFGSQHPPETLALRDPAFSPGFHNITHMVRQTYM
ncbi:hypothetical protein I79_025773 [Cricetulus griseus]|uniref:Uncharacterized protein n=1 Tax=Cricetulus griseus TaxID=10029 RepID=G3IP69_CRIGR|nr:hypothetical protein I79_025773 [Cricetulus griseus]